MDYDEYLESVEWGVRRKMKLAESGYRCQLCNSDIQPLHIHHRTCERLFDEHPADLVVLCRHCHDRFHNIHEIEKEERLIDEFAAAVEAENLLRLRTKVEL